MRLWCRWDADSKVLTSRSERVSSAKDAILDALLGLLLAGVIAGPAIVRGELVGAPTAETYDAREWQLPHLPNLTGTPQAYRPSGSTLREAARPAATGDYKAWQPGA